jgi:PIN domain nuclease of toxin-antitoxin system
MILMDTHIFIWFQLGTEDLKEIEIKQIMDAYQSGELYLSAISIWEMAMLEKMNRIAFHQPLGLWLKQALKGIKVIPIDAEIALESVQLPNCEHKNPADRFILATARVLNGQLMTHDKKLIDYSKQGHVNVYAY